MPDTMKSLMLVSTGVAVGSAASSDALRAGGRSSQSAGEWKASHGAEEPSLRSLSKRSAKPPAPLPMQSALTRFEGEMTSFTS